MSTFRTRAAGSGPRGPSVDGTPTRRRRDPRGGSAGSSSRAASWRGKATGARLLRAGEPAARDRGRFLVEPDWPALDRLEKRLPGHVRALLVGRLGLHLGDPLGRQLVGVLVLDALQPGGALGRLAGIDVDGAAVER